MIRLIASDIDGTLLQHGATAIHPTVFDEIRRLKEKGIAFCAASGRQYASLRSLFAPVADDIYFIGENGAVLYKDGVLLDKTTVDRQSAMAITHDILAQPNCEALISGPLVCYLMPKDESYVQHIQQFLGNETAVVSCPEEIEGDIVKISAYCKDGAVRYDAPLGDAWRDRFEVAVAGEKWLDFTVADKGTGIRALCRHLGVSLADTMAFGDNFNDLPMLRCVGHPYIMQDAMAKESAAFCKVTDSVENILKTL